MAASASTMAAPAFTNESELATDNGHILLEWEAQEPVELVMVEGEIASDGAVLYRGSEHSFFLSGLANGDYELRLRGEDGALSDPVHVSVAHQSLTQALWLTAIGALITVGIIATILRGARDD